ncbi:Hypothetical protein (plasmid) [Pseudomonas putida]|nr:Hypothetical protein [Pseudomonas putida]
MIPEPQTVRVIVCHLSAAMTLDSRFHPSYSTTLQAGPELLIHFLGSVITHNPE